MNKASEQMIKRTVILADGRYLILYTVAPAESDELSYSDAEARANPERPDEEI